MSPVVQCPVCRCNDTRVIDSRVTDEGATVRRRRSCETCEHRFTTFERLEEAPLVVVKRDRRREPYDRGKVVAGILAATKGRPVAAEVIAALADRVEERVRLMGAECSTSAVGRAVLEELRAIDEVSYLRFASVYKNFDAVADFRREIALLEKQSSEAING